MQELVSQTFWCADLVLSLPQTQNEMQTIPVVGYASIRDPAICAYGLFQHQAERPRSQPSICRSSEACSWPLSYICNEHQWSPILTKSVYCASKLVSNSSQYDWLASMWQQTHKERRKCRLKYLWSKKHYKLWTQRHITMEILQELVLWDFVYLALCKISYSLKT